MAEYSVAVHFILRVYWEPNNAGELTEQCKYIPVDLEKESSHEFLARLDFLSEPFTFAKDQLDVFAKTLMERLLMPDLEGEEDAEVEEA
jgi:hypothetical protein